MLSLVRAKTLKRWGKIHSLERLRNPPFFGVQNRRFGIHVEKTETGYIWAGPEIEWDVFQVNASL